MKAESSVRVWALVGELVKNGLPETRRKDRFGKMQGREDMNAGVAMALWERLSELIEVWTCIGSSDGDKSGEKVEIWLYWSETVVIFGNSTARGLQSGTSDVKKLLSNMRVLIVGKTSSANLSAAG